MTERFKLVFDELTRIEAADEDGRGLVVEVHEMKDELDEIDELRRLSLDVVDPEPKSYTAT